MIFRDTFYVKHILEAIEDIENSIRDLSALEFKQDKDARDATIRRIEIIGEAAKNISEKIKIKHPNIEWKKIIGIRDRMIHAYFNINLDLIWEIIKKDLPILKKQIIEIEKTLWLSYSF